MGLSLEQARELGRGNAIHQLQQNYQALSAEVTQLSTDIREVLNHLREDPGGGGRGRSPLTPRVEPHSVHTSSSHEDEPPRRERRPLGPPVDDLRDLKFDPPEFEGNLYPKAFLEWMQSIERFFEIKEYLDDKAFKIAILKLKRYASLWYENLKRQRSKDGKPRIKTWSKLKRLMTKRFLPDNYKGDLYLKVSSLSQGRSTVEEYIREFEQLQIRSGLEEEQDQTMAQFFRGLDPGIAEKVDLQPYWSFEDLCKLAIKVEKYSKGKKTFGGPFVKPTAPFKPFSAHKPEVTPKESGNKDKGKPFVKEVPRQLDGRKCFKCQGYGHFQADCPNRRVLTLREMEEIDCLASELVEKEDEVEEATTVLTPDVGELLVLQRILHAKEGTREEYQRDHIFHSRCTIQGKV